MSQQEFTGKSGAQKFMIEGEFTERMKHGKLPWTEKFHKKISEVIQMYLIISVLLLAIPSILKGKDKVPL